MGARTGTIAGHLRPFVPLAILCLLAPVVAAPNPAQQPIDVRVPCPDTATAEPVADPLLWTAGCVDAAVDSDSAVSGLLETWEVDLDRDGTTERIVGSPTDRGNAGGDHYVFRRSGEWYFYLGSLFLHPRAFTAIPVADDGRLRLVRYRRLAADAGRLETLTYDGRAFVVLASEAISPLGRDRLRYERLFAADRPDPAIFGWAAFRGEVRGGQEFDVAFGPGLHVRLEPMPLGWRITVRESGRPEDLARLTPPLHFSPNPREIEGWHFRNSDNTGPNEPGEKNVNAPGEVRDFIFSPQMGRTIQGPDARSGPTADEAEAVRSFGRGRLRILDHELDRLQPGETAAIRRMRFAIQLVWRNVGVAAPRR